MANIRKQLGLPEGPTFYSLKHLGNSYLQSRGATAAAAAYRMGHADDRMARSTYRVLLAEKSDAARIFDSAFPARGSEVPVVGGPSEGSEAA